MKLVGIVLLVACGGGDKARDKVVESIDMVCKCIDDACVERAKARADQAIAALSPPPDDLPALRARMAACVARASTPEAKAEGFCHDLASKLERMVDVPERHGMHQVTPADADRQRHQLLGDCMQGTWTEPQKQCLFLATTLAAVSACGIEIQ